MEFSLICPNDGRVTLGLEDISMIRFTDAETCDVVFVCPRCGTPLQASVRMTNMLAAAMELARLLREEKGSLSFEIVEAEMSEDEPDDVEDRVQRERVNEAYCEYFRRQLARIECVEDFLAEVDAR